MPAKPAQRHDALAGLFGEPDAPTAPPVTLPLSCIDPNPAQPRQTMDPAALQELAADIAAHGLLLPLLVRPRGDRYQIIAGARRYAAAVMAGLETVDVRVVEWDDATARAAAIRENVHREAMDPADEGRFYQTLQAEGLSYREIGAAVGKSHMYVARRIQLVTDPAALQAYQAARAAYQAVESGAVDPAEPGAPAPTVTRRYSKPTTFAKSHTPWAPFVSAARAAQHLDVTTLDAEARATLRDHVDNLLGQLDALRAELED